MERRGEKIKFTKETSQRRKTGKRKEEDGHACGQPGRAPAQAGEVGEIVAAGLLAHERYHSESANQSECINRCVKECGAKTFASARDQTKERVTGVRHRRVGQ